eukprot:TRINITY_DN1718_c0_g1_i1.p1 TRINITY_DN1718_c0_g1~~TRINITY_DN1718_c0_g1_i1.p1  ORF type:complete len:298 (-),score=95.98 TRINITY_DN1718_c0_g1_i1:51-944(-)
MSGGVTVLVIGGTGKTGQFTVHELLNGKWPSADAPQKVTVRLLARSAQKVKQMFPNYSEEQLEIIEGDISDTLSVGRAVNGADYVVLTVTSEHLFKFAELLGIKSFSKQHPFHVELQGGKAVIDAARSARVKHFVFCSSVGVTHPWGIAAILINTIASLAIAYKYPVEDYLRRSGIPYTIVRPGGLSDKKEGVAKNIKVEQGDKAMGGMISRVQTGRIFAKVLADPNAMGKTFECWEDASGKPYEALAFDSLARDDLKSLPNADKLRSQHVFAARFSFVLLVGGLGGGLFYLIRKFI